MTGLLKGDNDERGAGWKDQQWKWKAFTYAITVKGQGGVEGLIFCL